MFEPTAIWQMFLVLLFPCTVFTFLVMNTWQRWVSATEAGLIYCIEPVIAAILCGFLPGWISGYAGIDYPNEPLRWTLLIGGLLIVSATVLVATEKRTARFAQHPPPPGGGMFRYHVVWSGMGWYMAWKNNRINRIKRMRVGLALEPGSRARNCVSPLQGLGAFITRYPGLRPGLPFAALSGLKARMRRTVQRWLSLQGLGAFLTRYPGLRPGLPYAALSGLKAKIHRHRPAMVIA